jgi:hypothetical protein
MLIMVLLSGKQKSAAAAALFRLGEERTRDYPAASGPWNLPV